MTVYGLYDPRDTRDELLRIRYVGKTIHGIDDRIRTHLSEANRSSKKNTPKLAWLRSLVRENIVPQAYILHDAHGENSAKEECYWIMHLRSMGCQLTNLTDGGDGGDTISQLDPEHRAEIYARRVHGRPWLGKPSTIRGRKMGPHTQERRDNISKAKKGKSVPRSPEAAKKGGLKLKGRSKSPEHVAAMLAARTPQSCVKCRFECKSWVTFKAHQRGSKCVQRQLTASL